MHPRIRKARSREADAISRLAIRSKAHWGYTPDQMRVFAAELTLEPRDVEADETWVLEEESALLAFYRLVEHTQENVELEHLFVDPDHLREGFGVRLFEHARERTRQRGFSRMLIQSDPNAEGFYTARGAHVLMHMPTSIPGRTLPLMELWLSEPARSP